MFWCRTSHFWSNYGLIYWCIYSSHGLDDIIARSSGSSFHCWYPIFKWVAVMGGGLGANNMNMAAMVMCHIIAINMYSSGWDFINQWQNERWYNSDKYSVLYKKLQILKEIIWRLTRRFIWKPFWRVVLSKSCWCYLLSYTFHIPIWFITLWRFPFPFIWCRFTRSSGAPSSAMTIHAALGSHLALHQHLELHCATWSYSSKEDHMEYWSTLGGPMLTKQ